MAESLYQKYASLFALFGIKQVDVIAEHWQSPHRFYHNETHLQFLIDEIEKLYALDGINDHARHILLLTAFFHDIVYEPLANDNEEKSAQLLDKMVTARYPDAQIVREMILDTKTHEPKSQLSEVFCSLDMHIVESGSFAELQKWEFQIFKEYQMVDYKFYKQGRLKLLRKFAQRYPKNAHNLQNLIEYVEQHKPKIGIYAGSFNPFHNGHLNILQKAERVFDKVIIAKGINPEKHNNDKMGEDSSVLKYRQYETFTGLLTDYASSKETDTDMTIIRGLRNGDDLDYEVNQLRFMEDMKPDIKLIFINCDQQFEHISSSSIRNLERIREGLGRKYLPK
ncbi:adenylyltransferase/cytidyltransferase family protein [uncultured Microscilla sp.]|uniref:adenylyltransferase/cytidyltransferase family protein n=1 Tax=uncultured Microscilla sp. TaxID=432653 RepID=UPI00261ED716|nr:adenylyltransferase/cytidyltransferase family protein [uncultured Microscilla sp.]